MSLRVAIVVREAGNASSMSVRESARFEHGVAASSRVDLAYRLRSAPTDLLMQTMAFALTTPRVCAFDLSRPPLDFQPGILLC